MRKGVKEVINVAFMGLWENLYNPNFNCLEFEAIKSEAGSNGFVLTPKRWLDRRYPVAKN